MGTEGHGSGEVPAYVLTEHARAALRERIISVELLEHVLMHPALRRPDRADADLENWYASVPGGDGRVMKVVLAPDSPLRVVTVYYDRSMRGQL